MNKKYFKKHYIAKECFHQKSSLYMIVFFILLCLILFSGSLEGLRQDELVRPISEKILRFRILANSNSREDQQIKLLVRDGLLEHMSKQLGEAAAAEEIEAFINVHREELEILAEEMIAARGQRASVTLMLGNYYFPEKTYGTLTFPRGTYRALKVEIGAAKGENWWCVLYPGLCFTDAVTAVVPEESRQKLENVLTEEDYQVLEKRPEVRFRILDLLADIFK